MRLGSLLCVVKVMISVSPCLNFFAPSRQPGSCGLAPLSQSGVYPKHNQIRPASSRYWRYDKTASKSPKTPPGTLHNRLRHFSIQRQCLCTLPPSGVSSLECGASFGWAPRYIPWFTSSQSGSRQLRAHLTGDQASCSYPFCLE